MRHERPQPKLAERAIVSQLLRDDHPERWSRAELETEVPGIERLDLRDALARLDTEGVLVVKGEAVEASGCARYLDTLDLISI